MKRDARFAAALFAAAALLWTGRALCDTITLTTFYSDPATIYRDLFSSENLNIGVSGTAATTVQLKGLVRARNNLYGGWERAGSTRDVNDSSLNNGGRVTMNGDFSIYDSGGNRFLFAASPTSTAGLGQGRLGLGTAETYLWDNDCRLDIRGEMKTMILQVYKDPTTDDGPVSGIYNEFDNPPSYTAGFEAATGKKSTAANKYVSLYLDGNPLALQTVSKGASLKGQVYIKGDELAPSTDYLQILLVGKSGVTTTYAAATSWGAHSCSRALKTDFQPLSGTECFAYTEKIANTPVFHYRYKADPSTESRRVGFIAEESPSEFVVSDGRGGLTVEYRDVLGVLTTAAKGLKSETDDLKTRVEALKRQ